MTDRAGVTYSFGPYRLDPAEWRLVCGEEVVSLPPKAFALLQLLVENAGTLVTKGEILTRVWEGTFVEEGNVAFYVAMLRKTLSEPPGTQYIETVKTRGYRFAAPVTVLERTPIVSGRVPPIAEPAPPIADPPVATEPVPPAAEVAASARRTRRPLLIPAAALLLTIGGIVAALLWSRSESIESVVVVPFRAIPADGDQAHLESGIADAIAMRLGNATTLRVPPLAAVRRDEGPFEAGRRLDADAALTGTIQRAGTRLLVTTQLSAVDSGARLWSSTFDASAGEIFDVQNEIAERITARVGREVATGDPAGAPRRDTMSGEAYDLFLQARERWQRRTPESIKQAIELYERAIAIDPRFARAYAGLANCYNIAASGLPPEYRYPRAKANAEKAASLDPESAEAHTALAFMRYKFAWRWEDADREFQWAIKLNPRYALAHHWYGEFLALMDRPEEAIAELRRALELDPFSLAVRTDMTRPLMRMRRLDEARRVIEEGAQLDRHWHWSATFMGEILAMEGRDRESAEQTWRGMTLRGIPEDEVNELRAAFARRAVGRR